MTARTLAGGRYVVERPLGRGGMAVVELAHDTALDRQVAVKLLADREQGDRKLRERFVRESRFAARLSHPNVVATFDTGDEDGVPYIVMEHVAGPSLAEELQRRGRFPAREARELARQAAAGLAHAHERGLVHRDVKPQNLLLAPDGTLKVADFGIARAGDGSATLTEAGTLLGTAAYMAPEVVAGGEATPAADVYALGAVLYELVTGVPPRRAATIADLSPAEPPQPPGERVDGLEPELEETIMRCLAGRPEERPTAAELAASLDEPTRSRRVTEVVAAAPRARHRGLWLLAAAAVVVAAVLLLAVALPDGGGRPEPATVEPVPEGATPAEDARNLARWLRENAG